MGISVPSTSFCRVFDFRNGFGEEPACYRAVGVEFYGVFAEEGEKVFFDVAGDGVVVP